MADVEERLDAEFIVFVLFVCVCKVEAVLQVGKFITVTAGKFLDALMLVFEWIVN